MTVKDSQYEADKYSKVGNQVNYLESGVLPIYLQIDEFLRS